MALTREELRTAHLLFADELAEGRVAAEDLQRREVEEAVRSRPVPSALSRRLQARAVGSGRLGFAELAAPLAAARRAVLGTAADGPPRVLLGVGTIDAHDPAALEALAALHGRLSALGISALVGVALGTPARLPDPRRAALLGALADDGLELGLAVAGRGEGIEQAMPIVEALRGAPARIAVSRPGVLRARDWPGVARHVEVVAGPADVAGFGAHPAPAFRGRAVSAATLAPLAGDGEAVIAGLSEVAARRWDLWTPVWVDWRGPGAAAAVVAVAAAAAELAAPRPWGDLLAAAALSRGLEAAQAPTPRPAGRRGRGRPARRRPPGP